LRVLNCGGSILRRTREKGLFFTNQKGGKTHGGGPAGDHGGRIVRAVTRTEEKGRKKKAGTQSSRRTPARKTQIKRITDGQVLGNLERKTKKAGWQEAKTSFRRRPSPSKQGTGGIEKSRRFTQIRKKKGRIRL